MKLIVGLGNPGKEYENTRHNVGFMIIDNYLNKHNLQKFKTKFYGEYLIFDNKTEKIVFLKPQKYMNLSGEVIKSFVKFYKISINDLLIILKNCLNIYRILLQLKVQNLLFLE